jgi:glycine dehydrogenase
MPLTNRHPDRFEGRHLGPNAHDLVRMLETLGQPSLGALIDATVPAAIRLQRPLDLPRPLSEHELLAECRAIAGKNQVFKSYLGQGYSDCITPPVILRNVFENPGWYTQYTPYQPEIAQGRLEALLNYQTMIADLTALPVANASLLDEATAAAEAMALVHGAQGAKAQGAAFFVDKECYPQTLAVVQTRARPLGIEVVTGDPETFDFAGKKIFGALLQYPAGDGAVRDPRPFIARAHAAGALVVMACDLLSLALLAPPGELGADVAVGSSQRFGVPLGYGGPHAAFFATKQEYVRLLPGRIIGVSVDAQGRRALRMALQTREQHIRREKATSNICTAQALLAIIASMYGVYHGPQGIKGIALLVHELAGLLAAGVSKGGLGKVAHGAFFDTVRITLDGPHAAKVLAKGHERGQNLRQLDERTVAVSVDETTREADIGALLETLALALGKAAPKAAELRAQEGIPAALARTSAYLTHPVFNSHHSETEMLRYVRLLESRDLSLTRSMIALGSCTMKLNATAEMIPVTWAQFGGLHPFAPQEQVQGYRQIFDELSAYLAEVTGFAGVSLQPNAGAQGEYTGLLVIRAWHESRGEAHRDVCLIPQSAHGTNPASAAMCGYKVVVVKTSDNGDIDLADLEAKAAQHGKNLAALMMTYPSTYGVFEEDPKRICQIVHSHGGQVYMDGANMNAQVGLCRPGDFGADVCHLNLHKTFCIPHGGGGPGMGPIACAKHLAPFLPGHPVVETGGSSAIGPVSAAPFGSASILLISWAYIRMMGAEGLANATKYAILNANYVAKRLDASFPVLYRGSRGTVAHECIIDLRKVKKDAAIEVDDVAKRLIDYGFHAPTTSFPVIGTLMIEPTESEPKAELDRFCDALIAIRAEIREIEEGRASKEKNVLKSAPHTAEVVCSSAWDRPYSREQAAFPAPWVKATKFWPAVGRLNHVQGDRNLICSCPPVEEWEA